MSERWHGLPKPDFVVDRVANTKPEDIPDDIEALAFDVDGVLTFYHHPWLNGTIEMTLNRHAQQRPIALVTNSYERRAKQLDEIFKRVDLREIITPESVTKLGEKPSEHRKPKPDMLNYALGVLGVAAPEKLLMFGDQLFADTEASVRAGVRSVLVPRLGPLEHPGVRIFRRGPEAIVRTAMGGPVTKHDFPAVLTPFDEWRNASPRASAA